MARSDVFLTVLEFIYYYREDLLRFVVSVVLLSVFVKQRVGAARQPSPPSRVALIDRTPVRKLHPDEDGSPGTTEAEFRASLHAGQLHEAGQSILRMECASIDSLKQFLDVAFRHHSLNSIRLALREHRGKGQVDTVTYSNTIHACLLLRRCEEACTFLDDMLDAGMVPSANTFNAVLAQVVDGGLQKSKVWSICGDMVKAGVAPNYATGSAVLNMLGEDSSESDIRQVMGFVDSIGEFANEHLASSVLEAFMRMGSSSRVAEALERLQNDEAFEPVSSSTFSTLIKAYTSVGNVKGAWRYWRMLRAACCPMASPIVACMVEALVCKGDVDGAYSLVSELRADGRGVSCNASVFGHLLRGYGRQHRMANVWAVFQEMLDSKIKPELSTMNTMIDVCARNGQMWKVPKLLDIMRNFSLSPDFITYSIMIKGHCQGDNVQRALAVYNKMKQTAGVRCDEVVYNTLLRGCCTAKLIHESEMILQDMTQAGYNPPTYALVHLVHMYGRAQQIGEAFDVVARSTASPPESVLVALIRVSVAAQDVTSAMAAVEQMRRQGFQADLDTKESVVMAAISRGMLAEVQGMIHDILGPKGSKHRDGQGGIGRNAFLSRLTTKLRAHGHFDFAKRLVICTRTAGGLPRSPQAIS